MLQLWLVPQLQEDSKDFICKQDGAPPHFQCDSTKKNGPGQPFHFGVHRQALCWNFLNQSRIVLSVDGSVWYLVRNLRCTITIDSVLANSKTHFLIPCTHYFSSRLSPSGETCKYVMAPITQTNSERFSTY
jgi:hypothetical protein